MQLCTVPYFSRLELSAMEILRASPHSAAFPFFSRETRRTRMNPTILGRKWTRRKMKKGVCLATSTRPTAARRSDRPARQHASTYIAEQATQFAEGGHQHELADYICMHGPVS